MSLIALHLLTLLLLTRSIATKQDDAATLKELDGQKVTKALLKQDIEALEAKGLHPMSYDAGKESFKQTEAQCHNDMLLLEIFRMKEGHQISLSVRARMTAFRIRTNGLLRARCYLS